MVPVDDFFVRVVMGFVEEGRWSLFCCSGRAFAAGKLNCASENGWRAGCEYNGGAEETGGISE